MSSELYKQLKDYTSSRNEKSSDTESLLPISLKDVKLPKLPKFLNRVETAEENTSTDGIIPSLGRKQRILGFVCCLIMGMVCFSLAAMYAPFLVIKSRKFSLLFSLGSLFTLSSFSFLWGPMAHMKHLFSRERITFTLTYLLSLVGTLYFALVMQSTVLTAIAAIAQVLALSFFVLSNVPGGQTGIRFFTSIFSSMARKTASTVLPV